MSYEIKLFLRPVLVFALCLLLKADASADPIARQTGATETSVTVAWDAEPGAVGYEVRAFLHENVPGKESEKQTTSNTSMKIEGLTPDRKYNISIRVLFGDERDNNSYGSYGGDGASTLPKKPVKVQMLRWGNSDQINFEWDGFNSGKGLTSKSEYGQYGRARSEVVLIPASKKLKTVTYTGYAVNATCSGIDINTFYKVKVRKYVTMYNGKRVYTKWSTPIWVHPGIRPDFEDYKGQSKLKVKWDKVAGATDYMVYASDKSNKGYKKIATTKKTSVTVTKINNKKLKDWKIYYFIVIANKKVGNKIYRTTRYRFRPFTSGAGVEHWGIK